MSPEIAEKVYKSLEERLFMIMLSEGQPPNLAPLDAVEKKWTQCLEGVGLRRVGKLMGIIVQAEEGFVRLKDPLGNGGNYGYIEIEEETMKKIAVLGIP